MIAAIVELTAEHGYEATQIADIVRTARVARKTLYDNFDGKEDLFLATLDDVAEAMAKVVGEACEASEGGWPERVEAGLAALLAYLAENPAKARVCLIEAISATPASTGRHEKMVQRFVEMLRASAPDEADVPGTIADTVVGGVAWILYQQVRRGAVEQAPDLLAELTEFVLRPYARSDAALRQR